MCLGRGGTCRQSELITTALAIGYLRFSRMCCYPSFISGIPTPRGGAVGSGVGWPAVSGKVRGVERSSLYLSQIGERVATPCFLYNTDVVDFNVLRGLHALHYRICSCAWELHIEICKAPHSISDGRVPLLSLTGRPNTLPGETSD